MPESITHAQSKVRPLACWTAALRKAALRTVGAVALCTAQLGINVAQADATSLSLPEAIAMARANHPDLAVLRARIDAQTTVLQSARRSWFPTLTARAVAGLDYDDRPLILGATQVRLSSSASHVDGAATLDALIVDFGRRRHTVAAEQSGVRASEHAHEEGLRRVDLSVAELFVTVLAERSLVAEAERSLARQSELLTAVQALVEGKQRPRIDAQRLALDVNATRDAVKAAQLLFERDQALFLSALGLSPERAVSLQEPDATWFVTDDAKNSKVSDVAQTLRRAFAQRPTLQAALALERAAEERAVSARRATLPALSAQASALVRRDLAQSGQVPEGTRYAWSGVVTLGWKLDLVTFNEARRVAADALVASRNVEAERRRVQDDALLAHYERERAEVALKQAQHMLQAAQVTQVAQRRRYELGGASLLELLDAEAFLAAAGVRVVQATLDLALASVRLLASEGLLDQRLKNPDLR